ncbi:sigma-70 family RNA polymerase sigma factor, partial [Candidatus Poribacteria bacterium]|nr:sigma-70 family RNA polymerase sigma factor [Candidatus Poribacteria bacterium]
MKKSDAELIEQILSGNEEAFSALVQKYQKSVHALVWRKIGDFHVAEEVTQDTFLQVYKKLPTIKNPKRFPGWLYVIANRRCIAWLRKNDKHAEQSLDATSQDTLEETAYTCFVSDMREETEVQRRRIVVEKLLEMLPESERTVVILHYLGEMSCDAIGKFLGVSPNTVKSRLSRARNRLRENESLISDILGRVKLSPNLSESIMKDISDVRHTSPSNTKPLLPLASLGSSVLLVILLIGASNQYLTQFQLPYSFDAPSDTTIEIVESPITLNITPKFPAQYQLGKEGTSGKSSNEGIQEGNTSMQNDFVQDSTKWKLPEGAKARLGKGCIFDMAYSPDGTMLAAAGTIGIWLYDGRTGEELNLLIEPMESVSTVAFSPDNQLLASNSNDSDNTILLWDIQTGQVKTTLTGHNEKVSSVAFSSDGETLVSGSNDETIRLWDVATGELRLTFAGHAGGVSDVVFSPDGKMLVSHGGDDMIHQWDSHTGEYLRSLTGHESYIYSIAYSPDGTILASGFDDGTIQFWDANTGNLKTTVTHTTDSNGVWSVVFSPNGKTLVSTDFADDMIRFWDVSTGERLKTINCPPDTPRNVVFSPDGSTLVYAGGDGTLRFCDAENITPIRILTGYPDLIRDMEYSPDGSKFVVVSAGPLIQIWETNTNELIYTYSVDATIINCISYSPDGKTLACGGASIAYTAIWFLNTETGETERVFKERKDTIEAVAYSPDGKFIASGADNTIRLWDVNTGETIKILTDELSDEKDIMEIRFSPDGEMLVSKNATGIRMWDINTGETVKTVHHKDIPPELKEFWNVCSPDGRQYVGIDVVDYDSEGKLAFFNADSGEVIQSFSVGHKRSNWADNRWQDVGLFKYSPDGRTVATAGWDSS